MTALRFGQFSGEVPKLIARLLPDSGAQQVENVRLDDGGLTPVRRSRQEHVFSGISDIQTIYKFGDTWLAWDTVVNAVPGPVAEDRLYYTGDGVPKMRVGSTVYDLAVPYPSTALTASASGSGSGDIITRLYVYTYVTQFGEESEPCPVSNEVEWQSGKTITLSGFSAIPSGRGITKQRIYRSQSSSQSGTDLFFIAERNASTSDFTDIYAPDQFGEVLPSKDWNAPPDDLQGLIALPNGMMAAFTGKELCFCEPYRPHAWPEKYRLTAAFEIVGLGAYGTTVVAGTKGYPYAASGNSPESMIEEKLEVNLPCINGRGVVDLGYSVAYPSNDGLVVVSNGGPTVATANLFTRPQWQRIAPSTLVAGQFTGRYFASYQYLETDGVTVNEGTVAIDLTGQQPFVLRYPFKASAFYYDQPTGQLYYLDGNTVFEFDALGQQNEIMTWKSKRVVLPEPASMGAILVESGVVESPEQKQARLDALAEIEAFNSTLLAQDSMGSEIDGASIDTFSLNGDGLKSLPPPPFISVKVYADGTLVRTVSRLDHVQRIPGERRARVWEIQVNGTAQIEQIKLAGTVRELGTV